jgi:hypothetical protein
MQDGIGEGLCVSKSARAQIDSNCGHKISEVWIDGREEASRAELEGSRDYGDLYLQLE